MNQSRWFDCCQSIWAVRFQERIRGAGGDLTRLRKSSLVHGFERPREPRFEETRWVGLESQGLQLGGGELVVHGWGLWKRGNKRGLWFRKFFCQWPLSLALEEKGEMERKGNQDRGKEGKKGGWKVKLISSLFNLLKKGVDKTTWKQRSQSKPFFCWPGSTHLTRDPVIIPGRPPGRV